MVDIGEHLTEKQEIIAQDVPHNSTVVLVNPTKCWRMQFDGTKGDWVKFGTNPYTMPSNTYMVTHSYPIFEESKGRNLVVKRWTSHTCKPEQGFTETIFVVPGSDPVYVTLKQDAILVRVGDTYSEVQRNYGARDRVQVVMNSPGARRKIILQLPGEVVPEIS